MAGKKKLTAKEIAFCRHYVLLKEAKAAAIAAGYAAGSAKVSGHRLLQKPHIREEIARLEAKALRESDAVKGLITGANQLASAPESPQAKVLRADMDADTVIAATRNYILAGLIENFEIALGRRKRTIVRFRKIKGPDGKPNGEETIEVQIYDPNHNAANQAGLILLKEIGGSTADQPPDPAIAGKAAADPGLMEALATFRKSKPQDPA